MINDYLKHKDRIGSLLLFIFSIVFLKLSYAIDIHPTANQAFTARTLPVALSILLAICSIVHLMRPTDTELDDDITKWRWKEVTSLILLMAVYAISFSMLGFLLGSIAFLVVGFRILDERNYVRSLIIASTLVGTLWLLLTQLFGLYLDHGELVLGILKIVSN